MGHRTKPRPPRARPSSKTIEEMPSLVTLSSLPTGTGTMVIRGTARIIIPSKWNSRIGLRNEHKDEIIALLTKVALEFPLTRVFVYGTLMHRERNHRLLARSAFRGKALTEEGFALHDFGGYPGMIRDGSDRLSGEVYEVIPTCCMRWINLKDTPIGYTRTTIRLDDGSSVQAYLLTAKQIQGRRLISGGDWRKRTRPSSR